MITEKKIFFVNRQIVDEVSEWILKLLFVSGLFKSYVHLAYVFRPIFLFFK